MRKILVVEDEESIREVVALNLRMADYTVCEAASAEAQRRRLAEENARSESVPRGQGKTHCEVRLQTRPQCTISSTILSLILSIVQSLVYYKKHTSNLLTLKSESGILWSS